MSLLFFMPDSIGRNTKKDYIRIEHEAGGAARLAMSECDSDAIDKVADARANLSARRGRTRDAKPPMRRAPKADELIAHIWSML